MYTISEFCKGLEDSIVTRESFLPNIEQNGNTRVFFTSHIEGLRTIRKILQGLGYWDVDNELPNTAEKQTQIKQIISNLVTEWSENMVAAQNKGAKDTLVYTGLSSGALEASSYGAWMSVWPV